MSAPTRFNLLVVDDEPDLRTLYELTLLREGYEVSTASTVEDAWQQLQEHRFSAVITDMRLPDGTGLDLLQRLERAGRGERSIVITAYGSADNAVQALKAGAYDYLTKPVDLRQFRAVVASALGRAEAFPPEASVATPPRKIVGTKDSGADEYTRERRTEPAPSRALPVASTLDRMVGASFAMQQVRAMVAKVARSMAPVMIRGESGTGKELVARGIHESSARAAGGPFVAVNCGAIPEQLLEAEFFGYRKGAFTGANEDREGFFQAARGGTLFLDEIGDLPVAMQSKLLRAIQERAVRPVGAVAEVPTDVRLVSATHKDLATEVEGGRFRQDLYYRLNVIQIFMPPLRERMEDLTAICRLVLKRVALEASAPELSLGADALARLKQHEFPGNVRELENLLHRAVAMCSSDTIGVDDLGLPPLDDGETPADVSSAPRAFPLKSQQLLDEAGLPGDLAAYLDAVEREVLERALERHRYNRTAAGAAMGLTLRQMRYRMARLGIVSPETGDGNQDD